MQRNERAHPARLNPTIQATGTFPEARAKTWMRQLVDLDSERIADMDANGIDQQVLLLAFSGVQDFEPGQALELAKLVNERLSAAQGRHPTRLASLAVAPRQNPEAAARTSAAASKRWPRSSR